jgi:hypothetical protein
MTIWDYLKDHFHGWPKPGAVGVESQWISLGELNVSRQVLWTGDPFSATPDDGCSVRVPNGTYHVETKGIDFGLARRIARLRAYAKQHTHVVVGQQIGTVSTDCTNIAICDVAALAEFASGHDREFFDEIDRATGADPGIVTMHIDDDTFDIACVPSGFGDGNYKVFELTDVSKTLGIEVEFIPQGFVVDKSW